MAAEAIGLAVAVVVDELAAGLSVAIAVGDSAGRAGSAESWFNVKTAATLSATVATPRAASARGRTTHTLVFPTDKAVSERRLRPSRFRRLIRQRQ